MVAFRSLIFVSTCRNSPPNLMEVRAARPTEGRARIPRSRRLELRRRGVTADGVEALDVHLGQAARDRRIARDVAQSHLARPVDAEIRRLGEVVAARQAEPDVAHQRRRHNPREAEREALRAHTVLAERVVERTFREARQRRRPEHVGVDEAVAPKGRHVLHHLMIEPHVELILTRHGDRRRRVDGSARHVRIGNQRDDRGADRIPAGRAESPTVPARCG